MVVVGESRNSIRRKAGMWYADLSGGFNIN